MAVTSNLNIDFLRPLIGETVNIEGKMIKLGRVLAIIEVNIWGDNKEKISSRDLCLATHLSFCITLHKLGISLLKLSRVLLHFPQLLDFPLGFPQERQEPLP